MIRVKALFHALSFCTCIFLALNAFASNPEEDIVKEAIAGTSTDELAEIAEDVPDIQCRDVKITGYCELYRYYGSLTYYPRNRGPSCKFRCYTVELSQASFNPDDVSCPFGCAYPAINCSTNNDLIVNSGPSVQDHQVSASSEAACVQKAIQTCMPTKARVEFPCGAEQDDTDAGGEDPTPEPDIIDQDKGACSEKSNSACKGKNYGDSCTDALFPKAGTTCKYSSGFGGCYCG